MSTPSPSNLPNEQAIPNLTDSVNRLRCMVDGESVGIIYCPYDGSAGEKQDVRNVLAALQHANESLTAAQAQVAKLTEERDEHAKRLCISPFGDDKIDELEQARQFFLNEREINGKELTSLRAQVADLTRSLEAKQGLVEELQKKYNISFNALGKLVEYPLAREAMQECVDVDGAATQPAQSTAQGTEEIHRITETNEPTYPCFIWHPGNKRWTWFTGDPFPEKTWFSTGWTHFCTSKVRPTATPNDSN